MIAPRWKRILKLGGIAAVVIVIYAVLFGVQTMFAVSARYMYWHDPAVWEVPVEMTDASISKSPGKRLSYLGYEFEVPWDDLDEQKTKPVGPWQVITFHSGKGIVLMTFPAKERVNTFSGLGQKLDSKDAKKVRFLYGDETLRSDYAFTRACLEATPDKVTLFSTPNEALRRTMLLFLKMIAVPTTEAKSGIFFIQTPNFRGFQFGDPKSHPSAITDELFSDNGSVKITFTHCDKCDNCDKKNKETAIAISQAEINRVIQTLRIAH
ncbi:MAG TPA: hypothetical protein VMU16_03355 [Candidatus Binataceae bacterium]|nr:hypothetical protein [Candidatus Binataceae bacterium]